MMTEYPGNLIWMLNPCNHISRIRFKDERVRQWDHLEAAKRRTAFLTARISAVLKFTCPISRESIQYKKGEISNSHLDLSQNNHFEKWPFCKSNTILKEDKRIEESDRITIPFSQKKKHVVSVANTAKVCKKLLKILFYHSTFAARWRITQKFCCLVWNPCNAPFWQNYDHNLCGVGIIS